MHVGTKTRSKPTFVQLAGARIQVQLLEAEMPAYLREAPVTAASTLDVILAGFAVNHLPAPCEAGVLTAGSRTAGPTAQQPQATLRSTPLPQRPAENADTLRNLTAEGMGFEPTTPFGASDFESDRWPIRLPSSDLKCTSPSRVPQAGSTVAGPPTCLPTRGPVAPAVRKTRPAAAWVGFAGRRCR